MGPALPQKTLEQHRRDKTDLFKIPRLAKRSQFVLPLRLKKDSDASPRGWWSCKEAVSVVAVVKGADEEDWDLDEVMGSWQSDDPGRGQWKLFLRKGPYVAGHSLGSDFADFVTAMLTAKRSITLED